MASKHLTPQQENAAKEAGINYDPNMDRVAAAELSRYLSLIAAAELTIISKKPNKPYMMITTRKAPWTMRITYSTDPKVMHDEYAAGMFDPQKPVKSQAVHVADLFYYHVD